MKPNDEVIYSIAITGIKGLVAQGAISKELPQHIGTGKMLITSGAIAIPRLFTTWRGDEQEQAWQARLMEVVKERGAAIAIDVQPFSHAPGYPQGDLSL